MLLLLVVAWPSSLEHASGDAAAVAATCDSCLLVPCGECQEGCAQSACLLPDGTPFSRNGCANRNQGMLPPHCLFSPEARPPLPPKGAATWVYDERFGEVEAAWANDISAFNLEAPECSRLTTIFAYGGSLEWYASGVTPGQTYFPEANQRAARAYASVPGVTDVILVVDGRMDVAESWAPDLRQLTTAQLQAWATDTAALYCAHDVVSGVQLNLEPLSGQFLPSVIAFVARLSLELRSSDACVTAEHPHGRSISAFGAAAAATLDMWAALGSNGFFVLSGYDLSAEPAGEPSAVTEYAPRFNAELEAMLSSATASGGKFMVGIPAAASAHEFASHTTEAGEQIEGTAQVEYVRVALKALADKGVAESPYFLGAAVWGFAPKIAVPPGTDNVFLPNTPLTAAVRDHLMDNLCSLNELAAPSLTCEDVRHVLAGRFTCGARIDWLVSAMDLTTEEAQARVADEFPAECGPCASSGSTFALAAGAARPSALAGSVATIASGGAAVLVCSAAGLLVYRRRARPKAATTPRGRAAGTGVAMIMPPQVKPADLQRCSAALGEPSPVDRIMERV